MQWNWQQKDWPHFRYDSAQLAQFEAQFLKGEGLLLGVFKHLSAADQNTLLVEIISTEALKTSEIEGEFLNRASVQSSVRRQFGLETDNLKVSLAEQGIAEMMVDLYRTFLEPLSSKKLFDWHEMLMKGRRDLVDVGRYRTHEEPMQIVSGYVHAPTIHFEAPASSHVAHEMEQFLTWFNHSFAEKQSLQGILRAGISHLYFESIHPFEDGNGRIGRAIAEKALAQFYGEPTLLALAYTIESNRKAYYNALEKANKSNEITEWLVYFSTTVLEAQNHTQKRVTFLVEKTKLYDRISNHLNDRQKKVIERMLREGLDGFKGGLSAENYISITKTSRATATRDLQHLVALGALTKTGEKRYTRYGLPFVSGAMRAG